MWVENVGAVLINESVELIFINSLNSIAYPQTNHKSQAGT